MSEIKLFRTKDAVEELPATFVTVEKSLQTLFEQNLETLLGVRFLASEYSTGPIHRGRIDTLGIDENHTPVIIEYKRSTNENVINQGLYYLDWLLDHQAEFYLLVQRQLGQDIAERIEWISPRLICIAGDYTKFDKHAVQQIHRQIELFRYKRFGDDLLLLELFNSSSEQTVSSDTQDRTESRTESPISTHSIYKTFEDSFNKADTALLDLYEALRSYLLALGDDVQVKRLKNYEAYKVIRNIACVMIQPQIRNLIVTVRLNPDDVDLVHGFTRDVRMIGHWGTGDLEITIRSLEDLERAKPLLNRAYERS